MSFKTIIEYKIIDTLLDNNQKAQEAQLDKSAFQFSKLAVKYGTPKGFLPDGNFDNQVVFKYMGATVSISSYYKPRFCDVSIQFHDEEPKKRKKTFKECLKTAKDRLTPTETWSDISIDYGSSTHETTVRGLKDRILCRMILKRRKSEKLLAVVSEKMTRLK